jgi:hypothetical protein
VDQVGNELGERINEGQVKEEFHRIGGEVFGPIRYWQAAHRRTLATTPRVNPVLATRLAT